MITALAKNSTATAITLRKNGQCEDCGLEPRLLFVTAGGYREHGLCPDCAGTLATKDPTARVTGLTERGRAYYRAMIEMDWFLYSLITAEIRQ